MARRMTFAIASTPLRENLYAVLFLVDGDTREEWGILSNDEGPLVVEIFSPLNGSSWKLDYDQLMDVLQRAAHALTAPSG